MARAVSRRNGRTVVGVRLLDLVGGLRCGVRAARGQPTGLASGACGFVPGSAQRSLRTG